MKPFKIKVLLTYVFYVTIVIMHNIHAQLLTFQNGVFSQDSCLEILLVLSKENCFWNANNKFIIIKQSSRNGKVNKFGSSSTLKQLVSHFICIAL